MVGVERILEYATELPQEPHAPATRQFGDRAKLPAQSPPPRTASLPSDWPRFGKVQFDEVSMR